MKVLHFLLLKLLSVLVPSNHVLAQQTPQWENGWNFIMDG